MSATDSITVTQATNKVTVTAQGSVGLNAGGQIDGNLELIGNLTVGQNGAGKDVRFYGATSNKYFEWDASQDTVIITGDLRVDGQTTTINSTVVSISDPVFSLGGTSVPTSADSKDRGIEHFYYDTAAGAGKRGFFGYSNADNAYKFLTDCPDPSGAEIFTGTAATLLAGTVKAPTIGTVSGNLTLAPAGVYISFLGKKMYGSNVGLGYRTNAVSAYWMSMGPLDNPDASISRTAAGIVAVGNGTQNDASGTLVLAETHFGSSDMRIRNSSNRMIFSTSGSDGVTIGSSGNLGVGTVSPSGKISSYVSAARQINLHDGSAGGDFSVVCDNNSTPVAHIKGTGTADLLNVFDNTTEVFTILDGGNVGINQAAPTAPLHIGGGVSDTYAKIGHYWTFASNTLSSSGALKINAGSGEDIHLQENGTDRLIVRRTTGNIGIGVAAPADKLSVNLAANGDTVGFLHGGVSALEFERTSFDDVRITNTRAYTSLLALGTAGGVGINIKGQGNGNGSFVGIGTAAPAALLDIAGDAVFSEGASGNEITIGYNTSPPSGGSGLGLWAIGSGKMWLKGYSSLHLGYNKDLTVADSGNVGIGTAAPLASFHSTGTSSTFASTRGYAVFGDGSGDYGMTIYGSASSNGIINFADGTGSLQQNAGSINYDHANDSLKFATNQVERLRLESSGLVRVFGDLQVDGNTTTVNSTVVTIDDPVLTLGGDTAPSLDDNKDRGIEFRYYDGSAKIGFMGWDDSAGEFTLLKDATNSSEVFSGTAASLATGAISAGGHINLNDNQLQNVGVLQGTASGGLLLKHGDGNFALVGSTNGKVDIRHAGAVKLETTSTGIEVQGKAVLEQSADDNGLEIKGYDDKSGETFKAYVQSSGNSQINATRGLYLYSGDNYGGGIGSASNGLDWDSFNQFTFTAESSARIPLSIEGALGQSGDLFNITSNGGSAGDLLTVASDGKFGLGETSPAAKLHVKSAGAGSFTYDTNADDVIVESNSNGGITIATASGNVGRLIFASPDDPTGAEIRFSQTGNLMKVGPTTPNADLVLQAANSTEFLRLDASDDQTVASKNISFGDNVRAKFGASGDFLINHNGSTTRMVNNAGQLSIEQQAAGQSLVIEADNGSGGVTAYLTIDGGNERVTVSKPIVQAVGTIDPVSNGDLTFTAVSDTSLKIKYKGSDGSIRSTTLTLS